MNQFTKKRLIEEINLGDRVICDICGEEYTNSDMLGGITFGSKAVCPVCEPEMRRKAEEYGEERFVRQVAPENMTFRDFVVNILRKGAPGKITTYEVE